MRRAARSRRARSPARVPAEPLDRAGDRDRRHQLAGLREHRRRHRRHAGLALADRLRPAAPADLGQHPRRELRRREDVDERRRVRPRAQHLRAGPRGQRQAGCRPGRWCAARSRVRRRRRRPARCRRAGTAGRSRHTRRAPRPAPARPPTTSGSGNAAASSASRGPEHEAALPVARQQPVHLERNREPVGGGAGQLGRRRRARPGCAARSRSPPGWPRPCRRHRYRYAAAHC